MKFSSYPTVTSAAAADTFLIHQQSSNSEKQIAASDTANSLNALVSQDTVASLRAVNVTGLTTGVGRMLGGYYALGDGGGGPVYYSASSTAADNGGTVFAPNAGTGRWLRPTTQTFNVRQFGAKGDGSNNDTLSVQACFDAVKNNGNGSVYLPAGNYLCTADITLLNTPACNLTVYGDGPNVSIITQSGVNGLNLAFLNIGVDQPNRLVIENLGFQRTGQAGTGIIISYGNPAATSTHLAQSVIISNVSVKSDGGSNCWINGIDITSAWNCELSNVFVSGNPQGGTWANLAGDGIVLRRACNNSHFVNVQAGFFLNGFHYLAMGATANDANSQGLMFSNCSFTATRNGVLIEGNGNASPAPSVIGFQWAGGLTDLRGTLVGFDLRYVTDSRISGAFIIDGTGVGTSVGVSLANCKNVIVTACDIFAMNKGVITSGTTDSITVKGNIFTGVTTQVNFTGSTTNSRSGDNSLAASPAANPNEYNQSGNTNRVYQNEGLCAHVILAYGGAEQTVPNNTATMMSWNAFDVLDNVNNGVLWAIGDPTKLIVPVGVTRLRITAGVRWDANTSGYRYLRIIDNNANIWGASDTVASIDGDSTVISAVIDPTLTGITYFQLQVVQTSGGNLGVRSVHGTYFNIEILG
jgi:hypothetical protein